MLCGSASVFSSHIICTKGKQSLVEKEKKVLDVQLPLAHIDQG